MYHIKLLFYKKLRNIYNIYFKHLTYYSAKMENAHKEFQKAIGAAVCRYVPERGVLLAISRHENLHRHSTMLQEMHFRNLSQKVNYKISWENKKLDIF